jgi:anhydro-N-acetylmuramic acid kinase
MITRMKCMTMMTIGMMSGTSLDAVDAVLVDFSGHGVEVKAVASSPIPKGLKQQLWGLTQPCHDEIQVMLKAERELSELYVEVANTLLAKSGIKASQVAAIGAHGQTLRHQAHGAQTYTLQIIDEHWLAAHTGIPALCGFRRMDIARGGQGAPLMPPFHQRLFHCSDENRAVVNIGGIANVTCLPAQSNQPVQGFDTGPGNGLMDQWVGEHWVLPYDKNGELASKGKLHKPLLEAMLAHPFFAEPVPKSTGRDTFHLDWVRQCEHIQALAPLDVLATLLHVTAASIAQSVEGVDRLIVCGGGARNQTLMAVLQDYLPGVSVVSSLAYGMDPQWVEASGFAWLAYRHLSAIEV